MKSISWSTKFLKLNCDAENLSVVLADCWLLLCIPINLKTELAVEFQWHHSQTALSSSASAVPILKVQSDNGNHFRIHFLSRRMLNIILKLSFSGVSKWKPVWCSKFEKFLSFSILQHLLPYYLGSMKLPFLSSCLVDVFFPILKRFNQAFQASFTGKMDFLYFSSNKNLIYQFLRFLSQPLMNGRLTVGVTAKFLSILDLFTVFIKMWPTFSQLDSIFSKLSICFNLLISTSIH